MTDQPLPKPFTEPFAGKEAESYIAAYDQDARLLTRSTRTALKAAWSNELRRRNITSLSGGPMLKDEYVRAILEYRFPYIREAQERRAADYAAQEHARFVTGTAMLLVNVSGADLTEVLEAAGPYARGKLRNALALKAFGDD